MEDTSTFVAECFWPGVTESDVVLLDRRAERAASSSGVRYLGSILMHADEVVLCQFEGPHDAVQETARRAAVPYARLVETTRSARRREPTDTRGAP